MLKTTHFIPPHKCHVFPEPVTNSTKVSLFPQDSSIQTGSVYSFMVMEEDSSFTLDFKNKGS